MRLLFAVTLMALPVGTARADDRLDLYGDPLPEGAVARFGSVRLRHLGLHDFGVRPGGQEVVTVGDDGALHFWDLATGMRLRSVPLAEPVFRFRGPQNESRMGIFSAEGSYLLVHGKREIILLSADTGQVHKRLLMPTDERFRPTQAPGRFFALAAPSELVVCDAAAGTLRRVRLPVAVEQWLARNQNCWAELAPDERWLALAPGQGIGGYLVDLVGGRVVRHWHELRSFLGFTPANELLVTLPENDAPGGVIVSTVIDPTGRRPDREFPCRLPLETRITFAPDGRALLARSGHWCCEIDFPTGRRRRLLPDSVERWRYHPDGRSVIFQRGQQLCVWDRETWRERSARPAPEPVGSLALSPDRRLLAVERHEEPVSQVWDAATGRLVAQLAVAKYEFRVKDVQFSPDGRRIQFSQAIIAAGNTWFAWSQPTVQSWDAATGKGRRVVHCELPADRRDAELDFFSLHPDRRRAVGMLRWTQNTPAELLHWDATTGALLSRQTCPAKDGLDGLAGTALALNHLSREDDDVFNLWDAATGRELWRRTEFAFGCASPDGRLLVGTPLGTRERFVVVEAATGRDIATVPGRITGTVSFAQSGRLFARLRDGALECWDVATGRPLLRRTPPDATAGRFTDILLAPDGRQAYTTQRDGTILAWELPPPPHLPVDFGTAWDDLASGDAGRAWRTVWALGENTPTAVVAFLRPRLTLKEKPNPGEVLRLLRDLDDNAAVTRDRAQRRLAELGDAVLPELKQALAQQPSPEARRRLEALLAGVTPSRGTLQQVRAIAVLERLATAPAQALLRELAAGHPTTADEAKLALTRLAERGIP